MLEYHFRKVHLEKNVLSCRKLCRDVAKWKEGVSGFQVEEAVSVRP